MNPARVPRQVVVLRDPTRAPDDVPRASRPREQRYVFDAAFDASATQVRPSGLAGHGDVGLGARCGAAGRAPGPLTLPQETVYRATTRGLVAGVLSGSNATVFAYGPTGEGHGDGGARERASPTAGAAGGGPSPW